MKKRDETWCDFVGHIDARVVFAAPATASSVDAAETDLGVQFSWQLRSLVLESDGLTGEYELGLVWPIARIVEENHWFRREHRSIAGMSSRQTLFFGDAGNGEWFGHLLLPTTDTEAVVVWNPIEMTLVRVAANLDDYLERWLSGSLKI